MTFVHSFWSKPLLEGKFNKFDTQLPVILSDYAYSAACIKHFGHKIKLYTDDFGKELLSFIGYDEIIVIDGIDEKSIHFAAQIKFEALKRMGLDEYLIDGDMFLRRQPIYDILESIHTDFLYSFYEPYNYIFGYDLEHSTKLYRSELEIMKKYEDKFIAPYTLEEDLNKYEWPNTSLMKFGNQHLKEEYIRQYEYYKNLLENEDFTSWPDVIIEQFHMGKLLNTGYKSRPVVYDFPSNESNNYAYVIGFCHLGSQKVALLEKTFEWLKELDEKLYNKTMKTIDKFKKEQL